MTERRSYSTRSVGVLALAAVLAGAAGAPAQSESLCAGAALTLECHLAGAAVELIQPRVGLALWGGNPAPGTAGTLGFRIGRTPRVSGAARMALVPTALPPLLDRTVADGRTGLIGAFSLQSSFALVHGASPIPTVGGVLSVDLIGRASVARVPVGKGFDNGAVWGAAAGVRVGLLRESFTLPGLSLTAMYGHSTRITYGDPSGISGDGYARGSVSGLRLAGAVSRRILGTRLSGGVSWDRYASAVDVRYDGAPSAGPGSVVEGDLIMRRWAGFGGLTWTRLVYHATLEIGWQETPSLPTLPVNVDVSPMAWWAGLAFRVTL